MKQKLTLAQAFLERPRLLILDEPFNALDSQSADAQASRLYEHKSSGGSILLVSHDRDLMRSLCDVEVLLAGGGGYSVRTG